MENTSNNTNDYRCDFDRDNIYVRRTKFTKENGIE